MATSSLSPRASSDPRPCPPSFLSLPLDILDPTLQLLFPLKLWSTAQIHASQLARLAIGTVRPRISQPRRLPDRRPHSQVTQPGQRNSPEPATPLALRLPGLERLTVTASALGGDVPPAEAWEGAASLKALTVERLKHEAVMAWETRREFLAFFPPGLVHLFIRDGDIPHPAVSTFAPLTALRRLELGYAQFAKFGDAILPSMPILEALNLERAAKWTPWRLCGLLARPAGCRL
ncbi:hypothetical protein BDK51DRAFT_41549 [Blyttiomyces helicus]|uniref:F-box domain-containing protein n=1 Tax=Blyttiomyces helicus TaxID=388810 RepID=A0A4P9WFN0_9FUNG|nr:hypothetical protein BDK51DRAFT_41549 [Blyttiomyces helicus]|eukprot:RKO91212.1 hypothetical protein BDK51DRAFT_41549 [Blyttiomyces helicus]